MKVETWHTGHPLDEERFNIALKRTFQHLGNSISGADFEEAISQLALELHPEWPEEHRNNLVNEFATQAERISSYLTDSQSY